MVSRFDEVQDHIGIAQGLERGGAHNVLQCDRRFEQARRVDEDGLRVIEGEDAGDAVARGLGRGLVMASFWPTRRLRSVDFPTLGLPTTATNPDLVNWLR
jgi:hypothetical protein